MDPIERRDYRGDLTRTVLAVLIIGVIDRNPQRPTYAVAKSSNTGGRTGFSISLGTIPNYADSTDGMLLDGVRDGSPADKAGLKAGDKVVKLAGRDIRNVYDYTDTLVDMKADQEYEIVVMRGGERMTFKITPVKR
jgi:S1-C subfamily serine protease